KTAERLWVTVGYNNYGTIFEIDTNDLSVIRTIDIGTLFPSSYEKISISALSKINNNLYVGTNKGLVEIDLDTGAPLKSYGADMLGGKDIEYARSIDSNKLIFATDYQLFFFNQVTKKIDQFFSTRSEASEYLRLVTALRVNNSKVYVGTNAGFMVFSEDGRLINDINQPFFLEVDQFGKRIGNGALVEGEIINFGFDGENNLFLESLHGRIAIYDNTAKRIEKSLIITTPGYLDFRWRNYIDLWNNIDFGLYLKNSFIICSMTMLVAMVLATITAYALVRFPFPGAKTMSIAIIATQMVPQILFLIPIHIMFTNFTKATGIPVHGTYAGIIFVYSAIFLPMSVWILRGFFAAIPIALEEAARIDGCSPLQVFLKISLPLAVPGVIATGVFMFLTAWDELMIAWILTTGNTMTIPVGIRLFVGNFQNRFDLVMAAATVSTIPVMIMFFLLQRHIVSGLTAGAVKE
ncbi:MAG: carbohydrate ABC transporter permease, partial [Candidatus Margulisiibacteriota bacterium]